MPPRRAPCALGRARDEIAILRDPGFSREARVVLPGRVVLGGLALLRGAFLRLDDYRLGTAARTILGRGELFGPDDRGEQIEASYRDDPARLAEYNLEDARLVRDLLEKTGLIELSVRRSLLTGMQARSRGAQIAAIDSLHLPALRARGEVAPSVSRRRRRRGGDRRRPGARFARGSTATSWCTITRASIRASFAHSTSTR